MAGGWSGGGVPPREIEPSKKFRDRALNPTSGWILGGPPSVSVRRTVRPLGINLRGRWRWKGENNSRDR